MHKSDTVHSPIRRSHELLEKIQCDVDAIEFKWAETGYRVTQERRTDGCAHTQIGMPGLKVWAIFPDFHWLTYLDAARSSDRSFKSGKKSPQHILYIGSS